MNEILVGTELQDVTEIDLTKSANRNQGYNVLEDLVLIGIPVYYREIPEVVLPFFKRLTGNKKPVFIVAVYGNVTEGNTINQLKNLLETKNFYVIGGASFIAEHSFSHEEFPIAHGRPDAQDLKIAHSIGQQIIKKLVNFDRILDIPKPPFPESTAITPSPHKGMAKFIVEQPVLNPESCMKCQNCVESCPTDAIESDTFLINESDCIRCFACVKSCPNNARQIKFKWIPPFFKKAQKKRREPQIYL
ncbi:MAG: 4Fe-4S binding protein [Candidatus Helarchaeota archaeon]|nr:4Fe-4S binding protein [Candidatus Helarchaeota archaeon]